MLRRFRPWLALASIPVLATCGSEVVGVADLIDSIVVTPSGSSIPALGFTRQFAATARDQDGNLLSGKDFTWSSSTPSVATIDPTTGAAISVGNGSTTITAMAEGVSGSAVLMVDQVVTALALSAGSTSLTALGATTTLTAMASDARGNPVPGASIEWDSSDPTVVTVSPSGLATAAANGSASVAASVEAVSQSIVLNVMQVTSQLDIVTQPSPTAVAGVVFQQQPSVQLLDANGYQVNAEGVSVTASVSSGTGTLSGTRTVQTSATGLASFDNLAITGSGLHRLAFSVANVGTATSSPVALSSGATDPSQSTATLPINSIAGNPVSVTIQAQDASGNPVTSGGDDVVVNVWGANSVTPLVTDNGNGIYSTAYSPTIAGTDVIDIAINGAPIAGSPFSTAIQPGPLSPPNSTADIPNGSAGNPTTIDIHSRDVYGNDVSTGGAIVSVTVTGANMANVPVADNGDGSYTAVYTPRNQGMDNIAVAMNGASVSGNPFTSLVAAGTADPIQSSASAPTSIAAGAKVTVTVEARDANGNVLTAGGEVVSVSISGANVISPGVTDMGDGTYEASYTPTVSGTDQIAVTLNGAAVNGSPYAITVDPGPVDASQSSATVPAAGTANVMTPIVVVARDGFGNQQSSGGETVVVSVTGANSATPAIVDEGTGRYLTSYTPTIAGTDNVAISINGDAIAGSPFVTTVDEGGAVPSQSTASVPSVVTAGSPTDIVVIARDVSGNVLTKGGATVTVNVIGANSTSAAVTDNGDGTYTATYTPVVSGIDDISVSMNGSAIGGGPYAITVVPGPLDPATSSAEVPGGLLAGTQSNISITTKDAHGNELTSGGATVVVAVSGSNTASPTVADNGDGTYSASYTPIAAGNDNVSITLNGSPINGSPFTTMVAAGAPDAGQSTASVPSTGQAGTGTTISVTARDANGNLLAVGGAKVVVSVTGANTANPSVTDNGDGTYTASYTPTIAGADDVEITINGSPIGGSPFTSTVAPGPASAEETTATVPLSGTSGAASSITVQARDAHGNELTSGGATVVATVTGANAASPTITDEGDGTYTASYTPSATGIDNIAITLDGAPISGSPFASTIAVGDADASESTASVPSAGTVGSTTDITVQARDTNGNPLSSGGSTVVVSVSGANSAAPTVTDQGDGTYTTAYTPTSVGIDNISITLDGDDIDASPFTSTVSPGDVDPTQSTATVPNGIVGQTTNIIVQARDLNGNALTTGGETVVITVTGANTATPSVTDQGDGTYTASYTPVAGGDDEVVITLNSVAINGSPFTSSVAGGADPAQSTAIVPAAGTPDVATNITVQARDADGNSMSVGGETVVVTVTGANSATPTVTDEGDGTYSASYTPASVGSDDIEITMNGVAISGSPFSSIISVDNESDPANTFAIVPNGTPGDVTTLLVRARNASDQNVSTGGGAVVISITGTNPATPSVTDNGDGTYSATYTPASAGADDIAITLNGTPIEGSPYISTVSPITALTGKISYERLESPFDDNSDVIIMNEDGTGMVNLTNNTNFSDERPGISPDGTKIVFNSDRDGDQDIYVMNSNGSNVTQITNAPGRDRLPVWSPDGTKILFLSERDGEPDIYVINADGTGETALTFNSVEDYQADWSPDGSRIAFYASENGDFEVYTMNADGSNREVLIDLPDSREVEVSWGVGGIVFISDMDTGGFPNRTQIYKIQPDGTGLTRLTNNANWDYMPEWSADGTRIVFITSRDGNGGEIYVMNGDGTNQTRLTDDPGAEWAPKFQY